MGLSAVRLGGPGRRPEFRGAPTPGPLSGRVPPLFPPLGQPGTQGRREGKEITNSVPSAGLLPSDRSHPGGSQDRARHGGGLAAQLPRLPGPPRAPLGHSPTPPSLGLRS